MFVCVAMMKGDSEVEDGVPPPKMKPEAVPLVAAEIEFEFAPPNTKG